jgi:hypothetical protein
MNWKTDLKLTDLDAGTQIEVVCKRCGLSRYELQAALMLRPDLAQAYLDEVEHALRCSNRSCRGIVRIALLHEHKTEGFIGGMP